ncbi:hypothetical protein SEUCBS139899_001080 [Sporothrix eucalyptigena]|uniref:JmjC domain-containing protein n=1 Tax=Sporothrix eucalyptigena TaxID=1812306 RepID=A0ABP0B5U7_9PEZI
MPPVAIHPQAKFDPIPPDLDLHALVQDTPNFEWATQISASEISALSQQRFEKLVSIHVINGGKPLVIKDWNDRLPNSLFSAKWLEEEYNRKEERVWDINGKTNIPMTMGHYLRSMKQLTNQWTPRNFRDERRQRLYLKDIDCPPEWQEKLSKTLPRLIFYLNEDIDGTHSKRSHHRNRQSMADDDGDGDMFVDDRPTARAGDLMSSLPPAMRAENLMCYIGHEGTYTPAHREMCASLGQNIMVEASGSENGEKPGSSIWFMTETKDREVVSEYFLSMLGHDVEIEKHFAQINAWKKAAFPVYIVEQKVGDLILVPPLAPHQVWNRGTRTMKVAWNRTVVETLEMALHEALPKARLVCRDEQYKNKAIIYYTMQKYYKELKYSQTDRQFVSFGISQDPVRNPMRTAQIADDFKKLMRLYTDILVDEMFNTKEKNVEYVPFDSNITCSYCRSNIFNRFLTCKHCVRTLADGDEDTYDVCMECYAMGRSCMCVSGLGWCEQWPWEELVSNYDKWQAMVVSNDGFIDAFSSPPPLEVARLRSGKKPVAQICQEQLCRRPFRDITKPVVEDEKLQEPEEPEVDDEGRVKKKPKGRTAKKGDTYRCHVCCHKDHRYRLAFCTTPGCVEAYCYGVLYRGFDMMPQSVMQQEYWKCPRCMKICNCGACRRAGITNPYIPKGTLLGHDTRPIADDRSVESLINFRLHNLLWLKNSGDESRNVASKRIQKLREKADAAKAQGKDGTLEDDFGNAQGGGAVGTNGHGDGTSASANAHDTNGGFADTNVDGQPPNQAHEGDVGVNPGLLHDSTATSYPELEDYPDPAATMLNNELAFGRAYYMDDDNSPNKILFDPYHEPAPNPTVGSLGSMETLPEFLESYTHKRIRKPRPEKDLDPDYTGPKRKKKKPAPKPAPDAVMDPNLNLDPALLSAQHPPPAGASNGEDGQLPTGADAGNGAAPTGGATTSSIGDALASALASAGIHPTGITQNFNAVDTAAAAKDTATEDEEDENPHGYPANVPELRHARPKVSYLVDVASDNEADDEPPAEKCVVFNDASMLPSVETAQPADNTPVAEANTTTPSDRNDNGTMDVDTYRAEPPKKRSRPPRLTTGDATAAAPSSKPSAKRSRTAALLNFPGKSSEGLASVWKPIKAGRGRPAEHAFDSDNGSGKDNDTPAVVKRKLGRPPKSVGRPSLPAASDEPDTPRLPSPPTTRSMSMAERMALKGKKSKMGKKTKVDKDGKDGSESKGSSTINSPSIAKAPSKPSATTTSIILDTISPEKNSTRLKPAPASSSNASRRASTSDERSDDEEFPRPKMAPTRGGLSSRGRGASGRGRRRPPGPTRGDRVLGPTIVRLAESGSDGSGSGSGSDSGVDYHEGSGKSTSRRRGKSDEDNEVSDDSGSFDGQQLYLARRGGGVHGRGWGRGRGRGRGRSAGLTRQDLEVVLA